MPYTPDEELAMEQVATGECSTMSPRLSEHVHRIAAHALTRRNRELHEQIRLLTEQLDRARGDLARYKQEVRAATLNVLADEGVR